MFVRVKHVAMRLSMRRHAFAEWCIRKFEWAFHRLVFCNKKSTAGKAKGASWDVFLLCVCVHTTTKQNANRIFHTREDALLISSFVEQMQIGQYAKLAESTSLRESRVRVENVVAQKALCVRAFCNWDVQGVRHVYASTCSGHYRHFGANNTFDICPTALGQTEHYAKHTHTHTPLQNMWIQKTMKLEETEATGAWKHMLEPIC